MYEVDCPRCRHTYDVGKKAPTGTCPACALTVDLLSEDDARRLGFPVPPPPRRSPPARTAPAPPPPKREAPKPSPPATPAPSAPPPAAPAAGPAYLEAPCPACEGPLLIAPEDVDGLCAHCETPLDFDYPNVRLADAPSAAGSANADVGDDEDTALARKPAERPPAFDPVVRITRDNAPLVETRSTPRADAAAEAAGKTSEATLAVTGAVVFALVLPSGSGAPADPLDGALAALPTTWPSLDLLAFEAPPHTDAYFIVTPVEALPDVDEDPADRSTYAAAGRGAEEATEDEVSFGLDEEDAQPETPASRGNDLEFIEELPMEPDGDVELEPEAPAPAARRARPVVVDRPRDTAEPPLQITPRIAPLVEVKNGAAAPPKDAPAVDAGTAKDERRRATPTPAPDRPRRAPAPRGPVERVIDPETPDGIPYARHAKTAKDLEIAVLEVCTECTHPFRHHPRDREVQCPHCGSFLEIVPFSESTPTPPAKPDAAPLDAPVARRKPKGEVPHAEEEILVEEEAVVAVRSGPAHEEEAVLLDEPEEELLMAADVVPTEEVEVLTMEEEVVAVPAPPVPARAAEGEETAEEEVPLEAAESFELDVEEAVQTAEPEPAAEPRPVSRLAFWKRGKEEPAAVEEPVLQEEPEIEMPIADALDLELEEEPAEEPRGSVLEPEPQAVPETEDTLELSLDEEPEAEDLPRVELALDREPEPDLDDAAASAPAPRMNAPQNDEPLAGPVLEAFGADDDPDAFPNFEVASMEEVDGADAGADAPPARPGRRGFRRHH